VVIGRRAGLWVHSQQARPAPGLHRTLIESLGTSLGDPEVFRLDRQRLERVVACCAGS